MQLSLRNKFLIPTVLLIIVGMGGVTVVSYILSRNALQENMTRQVLQQAESTAKFMNSWIVDRKLDVVSWGDQKLYQTAVKDSFVGKAARKPANVQLLNLKQEYPGYEDIHVATLTGAVVVSSNEALVDKLNVSAHPYFQDAVKGNVSVSEVSKSDLTDNPVFIIATPIKEENVIIGVLCGVVDLNYLNQQFIEPIKFGKSGYAYLYAADGLVIAHPDKTNVLQENITSSDFGRQMLKIQEGLLIYPWKGTERLECFKKIKEMGWTIGLVALTEELFAPVKSIRNVNMLVAVAIVSLSVVSILLLVHSIVKPIKHLARTADQLAQGNISGGLQEFGTRDEIGMLSEAFKNLVTYIQGNVQIAEKIAGGDLSVKVKILSEQDVLGKSFNLMVMTLKTIIADINILIESAREGKLSIRGDAAKFEGEYARIIRGINATLDAVINPVTLSAEYMKRISKGDFPESITAEYKGDFNEIKQNLNLLLDNIRNVLQEIQHLNQAIQAGKLDIRGNTETFAGDWRELVSGINKVIDAFVTPHKMAAEALDRIARGDLPDEITAAYKGDFNEMKNNLNMMLGAMHNITRLAEEMAAGNLTLTIKERSPQDRLMQALNTMLQRLSEVVLHVKSAADNVAFGSQAMNSSAEELSQGTAIQAASAEEASSSMEQMAANIRQNADNAKETEKIALKMVEYAEESGQVVAETVMAMKQIAQKIVIIEEIASQTRMLSLNATIEAARAHDHGKAFSVVAAEVRQLSDTVKKAAEEINELATSSLAVSEKAGAMLRTLLPSIRKTTELVQEISMANSEQSAGVEQINGAIQQLDHVIQQNVSTAETVAAASEELASQAKQLRSTMTFFKIAETAQRHDGENVKEAVHPKTITASGMMVKRMQEQPDDQGNKVTGEDRQPGHAMSKGKIGEQGDDLDAKFERY